MTSPASPSNRESLSNDEHQLRPRKQPPQPLLQAFQQQRPQQLCTTSTTLIDANDEEKNEKKMLEWELSELEADDVRSHAWYHGDLVDRAEAERLLRRCVADEHGVGAFVTSQRDEEDDSEDARSSCTSSDCDAELLDDRLESLDDEHRLNLSSKMAPALLLLKQSRHSNGQLPTTRPRRPIRRHFYCFLVRGSTNVRPPGRFVVSCLRVDKYDDNNKRHNDEQLRRKCRRRYRRQQRRPVLHFVINEIILQPGTVYERSQFTFGDTLPTVASMASASSAMMTNNNNELYGQRQYQPGFDSVPDLIRYYVGGADDNAVLSYGGGNEVTANNTVMPQLTRTDVRIRYPCNRHHSLTMPRKSGVVTPPVTVQEKMKHVEILRQNCPAISSAVLLPASEFQTPVDIINVPVEGISAPPHSQNRRCTPSPPPYVPHWKDASSGFRSIPRNTPSAAIVLAAVNSATSKGTSTARSVNSNPPWSTSLPRQSSSTLNPSRIGSGLLTSGFSSSSSLSQSSTTLPRPLKSSSSHTSISKLPLSLGPSNIPLRLSSSSEVSTFTPETTSLTCGPPVPQPELDSHQLSPKKLLRKLDTSFETFETPELSKTLSMSSICRTNISECFRSGVINMDVEIVATVGDGDNNNKFNRIPDTTIVQSSFARVNVSNDHRSRSGSRRNRSRSQKSESRLSRFDKRQVSGSELLLDIVKDSRDHKQLKPKQQLQREQRSSSLSSNVPSISSSKLEVETLKQRQQHVVVHPETLDDKSRLLYDVCPQIESEEESNQIFKKMDPRNWKRIEFEDSNDVEQLVEEGRKSTYPYECKIKTQHSELSKLSTEEQWADAEIERLVNEGLINPDQDSDFENSLSEHEDFDAWHNRWADWIRRKFVGTPELCRQLRHQRRRERLLRFQKRHLQEKSNSTAIDAFIERIYRIPSVEGTRRIVSLMPQDICPVADEFQNLNTDPETGIYLSSTRQSNINLVNMIRRWIGIYQGFGSVRNTITKLSDPMLIKHNDIKGQQVDNIQRQLLKRRWQLSKPIESAKLPSFVVGDTLPTGKGNSIHAISLTQVFDKHEGTTVKNPKMMEKIFNQHITDGNIGVYQRVIEPHISDATFGEVSDHLSTTTLHSTRNISGITNQEMDVNSARLACDYENIRFSKDSHDGYKNIEFQTNHIDNTVDQGGRRHHIGNNHSSNSINHHNYLRKINNYNIIENNISAGVDYENIGSCNTNDSDATNYENIGTNINKQCHRKNRQQLLYGNKGGGIAVASALRAIHMTIIGNPDDGGGITSVVGTGRLAAALCRADGRVSVLPYNKVHQEDIKKRTLKPILKSCPLQLLGQPGPAGRRARLDVIERFACLQYLVAMTVIVTPCLLLIGDDNSISEDNQLEWTLEDEYEYRRRQFYYRCAGADGMDLSGDNFNSDADYKLGSDLELTAGYQMPSEEEWAVEKCHWLDRLARHRAAALDKWIRTAVDTKQAVGDVYGYRALMSALCSDRIQALCDAWASLRQLHTTTAVEFESRLRPEFLGRRDKQTTSVAGEGSKSINDEHDEDMDVLLQLPPNATVPDATALAVLYEQMYNDDGNDCGHSPTVDSNENNSKHHKNYRLSSLFTSPLLQSSSPWSSPNSGIGCALRASATADFGLSALHILCTRYSEWVQQSMDEEVSTVSSSKKLLQLDRFRNNFRTLLRQYSGDNNGDQDHDDGDNNDGYVYAYNQGYCQKDNNSYCFEEHSYEHSDEKYPYERQYEEKIEEYRGGDYDECGNIDDDDDDDATVICCSNSSSITAMSSVIAYNTVSSTIDTMAPTNVEDKRQINKKTKDINRQRHHQEAANLEDDRYCRWIKSVGTKVRGEAPLDTVFHTELHVRLFWPPTLLLLENNDFKNSDKFSRLPVVPAYALGTTYIAMEATSSVVEGSVGDSHCTPSQPNLDQVMATQLDRAAEDMRLRYQAMDEFLDGACAYSTLAAKAAMVIGE